MKRTFLAGLTRAQFLRRHWQKKPLLARNALGTHTAAVTRDQLFDLATRDDVESRIVTQNRGRWQVRDGPFTHAALKRMGRSGWTLLVHGVDAHVDAAARLMREFAFLPYARLDDVMVSYAAPGGGVGPHFDSYDVFLVQGSGERRWRVGAQDDLELIADAPLRILRRFEPEREWTLGSGDVLYLPPRCAHDGVALGECITYSVGFRAPGAQELGTRFLDFLQDRLALEGRYADPGLATSRAPARIPAALVTWSGRTLEKLRWTKSDVAEFVGRASSEPRAGIVFGRPARPLTQTRFTREAARSGVVLAPGSRMLYRNRDIFINGEHLRAGIAAARTLARLADTRCLVPPLALDDETREFLYDAYLAGHILIRPRAWNR